MISQDPLIPRKILFADPEKVGIKQSPDGQFLSYLAPFEGNLNVWIAPISAWSLGTPISGSGSPIREYWWSAKEDYLLYVHDKGGDENWQLFGFELATGKTHCYTQQGLQVKIIHISKKITHQILIGLNQRDRRFHDVYLLDLATGQLACIYENNQYWDFLADEEYAVRIGIKVNSGGEFYDITNAEPRLVVKVAQHDLFGLFFYPRLKMGLSFDAKQLFLAQSISTNTSRLVKVALEDNQLSVLGGDVQADICDVIKDPHTHIPLAYAVNYQRKKWTALNSEIENDFEFLMALDNGDIEILSQTANNQQWIVGFIHDDSPIAYYHYDRSLKTAQHLFDSHQGFKEYVFTKMHPKVIKTRDGLNCVSYLSLPRQRDHAVPLVLLVHGGPNYRDFWGFNATHQWLANRGYAVLSVNYRASTGFGKAHVAAGHGEWAGKIHEDLLDAVQWAVDQGITTADKVVIMGRSFGGYETLVGLTMTPDVFCCGVDIVGPANLETMVQHFPPYWQIMKGVIQEMIGCDPKTEAGKAYLKERSPLSYADRIKKPLLIGHGCNDVRVLQSESDSMVAAMQANGIPVTYAIFPDEGHQFLHPGNRMAFYALAEAFLAKNVQGRVEAFDNAVCTSMQITVNDFNL